MERTDRIPGWYPATSVLLARLVSTLLSAKLHVLKLRVGRRTCNLEHLVTSPLMNLL
jgi:hypothetical protein